MADYCFPVIGYPSGPIPLHWNVSANAADLFAARGTPIQAMVDGVIDDASFNSIGGWSVYLIGNADTKSLHYYMAHMNEKPSVVTGQRVTCGTLLGKVGDSGNAAGTGTHCHIGIGASIKNGTGPEGGAGVPWPGNNCNKYLQFILDTLGSGAFKGGVTPPPPSVDYETVLRTLTAEQGGVLVSLRDRKAHLQEEVKQIDNIINEIIRNRPK